MAQANELQQWVKTLSPSEKRFISLIGKARAGSASQVLELFDWLNSSDEEEEIPAAAGFRSNLPTVSARLRELILDCLRLLGKDSDINATLRTHLDEVAILQSKKQWHAASRLLRKGKKLAYETSRYSFLLQFIELELQQIKQLPQNEAGSAFSELYREENEVLIKRENLRELRYRHDSLLMLARQFPFSRNPKIESQAIAFANVQLVNDNLGSDSYLENALAVNILGIRDQFLHTPEPAIKRYRDLLNKWKDKKDWQADQPDLLMTICKYYQNSCFISNFDPDILHSDLLFLQDFDGLPVEQLRAFRETMFHHKFIQSLNNGHLDTARALIPEIEEWLNREEAHLKETQVLPFLCNFCVAEFLAENFAGANKYITRILQIHNKKARIDIRDFALVMQPVVHYELGNYSLNEYLTRSGKRHFGKTEKQRNFQLLVLQNIELLEKSAEAKARNKVLEKFISSLEKLTGERSSTVPLLGLNEIFMWAISRKTNKPIPEVFMEEVKKVQASAENKPEEA
jgi:hypothetical protein